MPGSLLTNHDARLAFGVDVGWWGEPGVAVGSDLGATGDVPQVAAAQPSAANKREPIVTRTLVVMSLSICPSVRTRAQF